MALTEDRPNRLGLTEDRVSGNKYNPQEGFDISKTIKNVPGSAIEFGKGMVQPIIHPIDTAKALGSVAIGGVEKLIPGQQSSEPAFDATINFFKERYGGIDKLKATIQNDPVGFASDVATVLGASGAAAGKLGFATKGELLTKTGSAIEPIQLAKTIADKLGITDIAKKGVGMAGSGVAKGFGLLTGTHGAQEQILQDAMKGGADFSKTKAAVRGHLLGEDIIDDTKSALQQLADQRHDDYIGRLNKVKADPQVFSGVKDVLVNEIFRKDGLLERFGIELDKKGLNFKGSPIIDPAQQGAIAKAIEFIKDLGDDPTNFTPAKIDILKQKFGDLIGNGRRSDVFINKLYDETKDFLNKNVQGYEEMTKGYKEATNLIDEISKGISSKASMDTTLRKLNQIFKAEFEHRKGLVGELDKVGGENIAGQIAGNRAAAMVPRGLAGAVQLNNMINGIATLNPKYLLSLGLASPRVAAEFMMGLGVSARKANELLFQIYKPKPRAVANVAFQAGRIKQTQDQPQ